MTVSGIVQANGGPLAVVEGAVVRATDRDTGQVDGEAQTDINGSYAIQGLRSDRYSIEVTPPSGYLSVSPVHVTRPSSGELELKVDFSLPFHTPTEGIVTTIPAGTLIRKPANFFDLEGTTVKFTPNGADGYVVAGGNLNWLDPTSGVATVSSVLGEYDHLTVELPFPFPFAGRTWTRVYANSHGNLSFQRSERMNGPQRDHAAMRSVAAAMDSRSAAGLEAMIAVLWAQYEDTTISVVSNPDEVVITWRAVRFGPYNEHGYTPLGENLFQARLYVSGVIELAYRAVPERDGIVGLFDGLNARGRTVDTFDDPLGDVARGVLDITEIEWVDNGSVMLVRMTLAEDVPEQVADGEINYRVWLHFRDSVCWVGLAVTTGGRRTFARCDELGSSVGYRVHRTTIEIPISKTLLSGLGDHFSWDMDSVWWGRGESDHMFERRTVQVGELDRDLGATAGTVAGNLFEVFHYPSLRKTQTVISSIYERASANDEIVVTFTDFRMDDFFRRFTVSCGNRFNAGAGTGPINVPASRASPANGTAESDARRRLWVGHAAGFDAASR